MFGRATITLGIGPHSSCYLLTVNTISDRSDLGTNIARWSFGAANPWMLFIKDGIGVYNAGCLQPLTAHA